MNFHKVNYMNKCNVPKKRILVIINNKFSQDTAVLRKIVVQAKTWSLVIALFTFVILPFSQL